MTFEQAATRLVELAIANRGTVTARQVERDESLASERPLLSAAARALAGGTNVWSTTNDDDRAWFPYCSLTFSEIYGRGRSAMPRKRMVWKQLLNRR